MRTTKSRSELVTTALALAAFGALAWTERRRALRRPTEDSPRRVARNLAVAGIAAVATQLAMRPVAMPLTRLVERRRFGLVHLVSLPPWGRDALAVVLLDYTLYWWHVAEHRVEWLYRFHEVHHADLSVDVTTGLRFHFGEFLASVPWRAAQILLIGVSPRALGLWSSLTSLSVMFHHSNLRLPLRVERRLSRYVVTPRLHGIHHSIVPDEQGSNWSSGLTLWDRMHGTYRANVPQDGITIGVARLREPADVTLGKSLAMPFVDGSDRRQLPGSRRAPERPALPHADELVE